MATQLYWWRTSPFPVTDIALFSSAIKQVISDCFVDIWESGDGRVIVGTDSAGVDTEPLFEEPVLINEEIALLRSYGIENPEEATIFSVISHFLPDEETVSDFSPDQSPGVWLACISRQKMAELDGEAWAWSKNKDPVHTSIWDCLTQARKKGITF